MSEPNEKQELSNQDGGEQTGGSPEKTFTQSQLDGIIKERLAKERERATADIAQREQDLSQREFTYQAKELLTSRNLPLELLDAIKAPDLDTLQKSLDIITQHTAAFSPNPNRMPDMPPAGSIPDLGDSFIRHAMGLNKP